MSLSALAILAGSYAAMLLIFIQCNLVKYRRQLGRIYQEWLSEREGKIILRPYWYPHFFRGGCFLFGLIGVVAIGGVLVIYSLWREPTVPLSLVALL
jgi:hypothetical protein